MVETSESILIFVCLFYDQIGVEDCISTFQNQSTGTGQPEKQHCGGLPLCGVRPMTTKVKRAAAEEVKSDRLLPTQTLGRRQIQSKNFIQNIPKMPECTDLLLNYILGLF